jgi:mannosyl-3-phosphoglycerate phosphatase
MNPCVTPVPGRQSLLFSDVDGTLLDDGTSLGEVAGGWAALTGRVEVVLASSRTVDELIDLLDEIGAAADLIAENGACIAVRSAALARALGTTETVTRKGRRWHVACTAAPATAVIAAAARARDRHAATVVLAAELPPEQRLELFGGSRRAELALSRRCSVLAVPPGLSAASEAWLDMLRQEGFHAVVGGRWLVIWRGSDKGAAAEAYLAARHQLGTSPPLVAAIGDAANDAPLLRAVSTRFVVQRRDGDYDPSLLAIPATVPLGRAGHAGWREAVARLCGETTVAAAEGL